MRRDVYDDVTNRTPVLLRGRFPAAPLAGWRAGPREAVRIGPDEPGPRRAQEEGRGPEPTADPAADVPPAESIAVDPTTALAVVIAEAPAQAVSTAPDLRPPAPAQAPAAPSASPPAAARLPERGRPRGYGILLLAAFVFGSLFVAVLDRWAPAPAALGPSALAAIRENGAEARSLTKEVAESMARLEGRLDALPAPAPAPDLDPLRSELNDLRAQVKSLARSADQAAAVPASLHGVDARLAALDSAVKKLDEDVKRPAPRPPQPPPVSAPGPRTIRDLCASLLDRGAALYRQQRYADAVPLFAAWRTLDPQDPRAWYYSALAVGMSGQDWGGEPRALALKGVEAERAGGHPTAEVDAAFAGLVPATGKDWLAFFRRR